MQSSYYQRSIKLRVNYNVEQTSNVQDFYDYGDPWFKKSNFISYEWYWSGINAALKYRYLQRIPIWNDKAAK